MRMRPMGAFLFVTVADATFGQIIRRKLHRYTVASQNADIVLAHTTGNVGIYNMSIIQFYAKSGVGQGFNYRAFHFNIIFFGHSAFNAWKQ